MKQACLSIVAVMSLLGSTQRWAAAADALPPPSPPPPSLPSIEEFKERELRIKTVVSRVLPAVVAITSDTPIGKQLMATLLDGRNRQWQQQLQQRQLALR